MSTALDTAERWTVEVGKGTGAYRTRHSFDRFSQAIAHFNALQTHSGYKKRLMQVKPDGTRVLIARSITVRSDSP